MLKTEIVIADKLRELVNLVWRVRKKTQIVSRKNFRNGHCL